MEVATTGPSEETFDPSMLSDPLRHLNAMFPTSFEQVCISQNLSNPQTINPLRPSVSTSNAKTVEPAGLSLQQIQPPSSSTTRRISDSGVPFHIQPEPAPLQFYPNANDARPESSRAGPSGSKTTTTGAPGTSSGSQTTGKPPIQFSPFQSLLPASYTSNNSSNEAYEASRASSGGSNNKVKGEKKGRAGKEKEMERERGEKAGRKSEKASKKADDGEIRFLSSSLLPRAPLD